MPYPGRSSSFTVEPRFEGTSASGRYLPPQVRDYIIEQYRAGRSLREVAELTGRTHGAVRNVLERAGVPRRGRGAPAVRDQRS